jgi:hypothetical protein
MTSVFSKCFFSFSCLCLLANAVEAQEFNNEKAKTNQELKEEVVQLKKRVRALEEQIQKIQAALNFNNIKKPRVNPWSLRNKVIPLSSPKELATPKNNPKIPAGEKVESVSLSHACLAKQQQKNGSWRGQRNDHTLIVTSQALLAFINSGHSHRHGTYKSNVYRAAKFLQAKQDSDGWFQNSFPANAKDLMSHCSATLALGELYAVSRDFQLKKNLNKARDILLLGELKTGAWSWSGEGEADAFLSAHIIFTLKALKSSGVEVPPEVFGRSLKIFENYTNPQLGQIGQFSAKDNGAVGPKGFEAFSALPLTTATGTLGQIFCGKKTSDKTWLKSLNLLVSHTPRWTKDSTKSVDMMYWYFTTYSCFQAGGKTWKTWSSQLKSVLVNQQNKDGSWSPKGPWGLYYGKTWTTAKATQTLVLIQRWESANKR